MYKVFVNDRPIIFTSSLIKNEDYPIFNYREIFLNEIIRDVKRGKFKGAYLYTPFLKEVWARFCVDFHLKKAGGGLVINPLGEILFIFRAKKWDLPKGRIKFNENIEDTAIREVKEESGLSHVVIDKFLLNTYHLYPSKGRDRLKKTYWYLMKTNSNEELRPLLEEGIVKAEFFNSEDIHRIILQNTYVNIKTVYAYYLNSAK
ncbi:MAG: NUDIX domain-containing protein [Tenacibaculum sp.]|nr:NUDIX domain-containing protein [Tenacibaculum sp.]